MLIGKTKCHEGLKAFMSSFLVNHHDNYDLVSSQCVFLVPINVIVYCNIDRFNWRIT